MAKSKDSRSSEDQYRLQTVERALSVLQVFLTPSDGGELTLTEISDRLDLSQSTVYRFLITFKKAGYVEHNPLSGRYRLGVSCLALGDAFLRNNDIRQRAYSFLVELRDECGETVHLAFLEGREVVYLDKLAGLHPIGLMSSQIGGRSPAYCTGLGKALLAYLPETEIYRVFAGEELHRFTNNTTTSLDRLIEELREIKKLGYAIDNEEHEKGAGCIACPLFNHNGVVAAISISGPVERVLNNQSSDGLIKLVKKTAHEISAHIGGGQIEPGDGELLNKRW